MTSAFDPSVFLDVEQTEVNERRPLLPVENPADSNGCYMAVIGELKHSGGIMEKGDKVGQPWASVVIPLRIQVPPEVQTLGLNPELTVTDRAFIDLTPQGGIDNSKGKNRRQKDYRDALGMNVPGEPFSWRRVQGRPVKVKIKHREYQGILSEEVTVILPA